MYIDRGTEGEYIHLYCKMYLVTVSTRNLLYFHQRPKDRLVKMQIYVIRDACSYLDLKDFFYTEFKLISSLIVYRYKFYQICDAFMCVCVCARAVLSS